MQEATETEAIKLTEYKDKPFSAYYIGKKLIETDEDKYLIQQFIKEDKTEVEIWGFSMMNRKLANVPKGCFTKVTYTGTKVDGEKKQHQCTVFFDEKKFLTNITKNDTDDLPF